MLQALLRARSAIAILLGLLLVAVPAYAYAQDATTPEDDRCTSCHSEEGETWMASPHGSVDPDTGGLAGGASCVDCHGPYVKGHPEEGTIQLSIASELCQDCHTEVYDQWVHTQHAGEGVQCISCHTVHSQELRLTDETLCQSCHREGLSDSLHSAHIDGSVSCTSCHMDGLATVGDDDAGTAVAATGLANHDFVLVSANHCLDCHREDVGGTNTTVRLPAPDDAAGRTDTKSATPWILSAANLGFGLGVGAVVGILFMLVAGSYFGRRGK